MPAKVNPVIPGGVEPGLLQASRNVALTFFAEAGQLQLNVMELVIVQTMGPSICSAQVDASTLRELCTWDRGH